MSQDLEKNKLFAAILVAGIVAMLCGFVSHVLIHPHVPETAAIDIDTSALEAAGSGGAAGPTGPEPILALLATADVKKGEALSKACLACHSFEQGGANKVGPNLYGIVNAKKAHQGDFPYSDVIKGMAAKGDTWTYDNLNHFLYKPAGYAPGTKMSFPGLKKPQDRADVIAYLRTLAGSPAALPSADEMAAEAPVVEDDANKENVDEAEASDAQKAVVKEAAQPTQDAVKNNQAVGEEPAQGTANPALQPGVAK